MLSPCYKTLHGRKSDRSGIELRLLKRVAKELQVIIHGTTCNEAGVIGFMTVSRLAIDWAKVHVLVSPGPRQCPSLDRVASTELLRLRVRVDVYDQRSYRTAAPTREFAQPSQRCQQVGENSLNPLSSKRIDVGHTQDGCQAAER